MQTEPAFLTLSGVSYGYGTMAAVVDDVSWCLPTGAVHCLVGRSGCGKTTLLKLAAGLLLPDKGTVWRDQISVAVPASDVGFVFQTPCLLEWLSVLDNVLLPISLTQSVQQADRDKADALLMLVGLEGYGDQYPDHLSGGQQSRVALARALVTDPACLLMDEPFAALDALTREELQDDFLHLIQARNTCALFVTHDISEAVYLGDKVAVMDRGKIVSESAIALNRPRRTEVKYSDDFNTLCRDIRGAMGAQTKGTA